MNEGNSLLSTYSNCSSAKLDDQSNNDVVNDVLQSIFDAIVIDESQQNEPVDNNEITPPSNRRSSRVTRNTTKRSYIELLSPSSSIEYTEEDVSRVANVLTVFSPLPMMKWSAIRRLNNVVENPNVTTMIKQPIKPKINVD